MFLHCIYLMKYVTSFIFNNDDDSMTESSKKIFSDEVVKDVQSSWSTINSDLLAIGLDIFDRLFAAFPEYQQLFRPFKDVPRCELRFNERYRYHASAVVNALNTAIGNLNDPEKLVSVLSMVGKKHVKRNVTPENFSNTQRVILEAITAALGEKATEQILSSWNEVLAVAVSTIMKGAEEEEAKYI